MLSNALTAGLAAAYHPGLRPSSPAERRGTDGPDANQRAAQHIHLLAQDTNVVHDISPSARPAPATGIRNSDSTGASDRSPGVRC